MRTRNLTLIFAAVTGLFAQADVTMQKAMRKETLEGDLKGAIVLYEKAVAEAKGDRATASQALLHLAECHQKLGDAEARKIYERVVREYADQKEAANAARGKLATDPATHARGMINLQIWKEARLDTWGASVSPDGRFVSHPDWDTGDLAIHDFTTGTDRRITNKTNGWDSGDFAEESIIAPDGKQVAYAWFDGKARYELRLMPLTGTATARTLYRNEDISYIAPFDWSLDGKWIAVDIQREDRSVQIGLVDSVSGSLRVLKSGEWAGAGKLAFSPDGRFLAFDRPVSDNVEERGIFLLAVDGSREIPIAIHPSLNQVLSWSRDGSKLLFASDRTGTTSIFAISVKDGNPQGDAQLIRSNVGGVSPLGMTRAGVLYYGVSGGGVDIQAADVDFSSGKLLRVPAPVAPHFMGSNRQPDWSPDGKFLAYATKGIGGRFNTVTIQSIETGTIRQIRPKLGYLQWPRWSPDGNSFLTLGVDLKGRQGVFRIDAQSGETTNIVAGSDLRIPVPHPDGKRIYYGREIEHGAETAVVERDLVSGQERELFRRKVMASQSLSVSRDGRYIAVIAGDDTAAALTLIPLGGGEASEILRGTMASFVSSFGLFTSWTTDSQHVLLPSGKEVWAIPLSGGPTKKIDIGIDQIRGIRLQPGGNKLAFFTAGSYPGEIWTLENFLPDDKAKK